MSNTLKKIEFSVVILIVLDFWKLHSALFIQ